MEKHVLVLLPVTEEQKQILMDMAPDAEFRFGERKTATREDVLWAHAIIGNPSGELLQGGADHLEFLQLSSAGSETYVKPGLLSENTILCNATGSYGPGIGEYMVAATLCHFRRLHIYRDQQKAHTWLNLGRSRSCEESTVLVLGAGDIGSNYAKRMKALGCYVIGVRRSKKDNDMPDCFHEMHTIDELDALLPRADAVGMALPNTQSTAGLMDARRLGLMKPGSVLINVGRGNAIVTDALMDALKNGPLGSAALDVTDPEPLPADHPLWDFDNLTITPHNNGGSTNGTKDRLFTICSENFRKYLAGEPLEQVDRLTGYKVSR
ncbi:MAG: D-2-hydroxyacid dehydrogenase [Clostridiales bacterium]|nr:D-2-hydroxyacid dehydrogenase [Clostridiales bacterium]